MNSLGEWVAEHPQGTRALALAIVAFGTFSYIGLLRNYVRLDLLLKQHASDTARAASEALGG